MRDSVKPSGTSQSRFPLLSRYAMVAIVAAAADLLSKFVAVLALGANVVELGGPFSLMVVFNTGSAGGAMVGPYTGLLNVLVTISAIVLISSVAKALIAIDRRAALALGLVAGGAVGNLASMLTGPKGVADFIAVRLAADQVIVLNVADLFLWTGALALGPVIVTLVHAIRADRRRKAALA